MIHLIIIVLPSTNFPKCSGSNKNFGPEDDDSSLGVSIPPAQPPAARSPNQKEDYSVSTLVDLDKLLKAPLEEIYRTNTPGG
jgi:hypothetical protein